MLKWLQSITERRHARAEFRQKIVQEMGGMPPRHLMQVDTEPASLSPNSTGDSRESQSIVARMLATRHFSR